MESKEDLLKLLDEAPEGVGRVDHANNVVQFIEQYNLQEGDNTVPEKTLFKLYKNSVKTPYPKKKFALHMSEILVRRQTTTGHYYKLNMDAIRASDEVLRLASEKKNDKTKSLKYIASFERFLNRLDIDRGKYFIEGYVLFELYAKPYRASGRRVAIGYNYFLEFCRLYFEEKRQGRTRAAWFGIDRGIMHNVSSKEIERIRNRRKNSVKKKRRSKKNSRERESCVETQQREIQSIETRDEPKE